MVSYVKLIRLCVKSCGEYTGYIFHTLVRLNDLRRRIVMAVNLYDAANELERAIRQSDEYTRLKKMYQEVYADPTARKMFESFRDIQMNLQQKQMMGQDISQQEVEQAQKMVQLVQQNPKIVQLMEAEQHMSMIIADLNKVIMKPLEELYSSNQ
jgi:cell fate (sporulation/competence/biofilm development) regulator YlbF (YheA/YmcA/DUF963 family)